MLTITFDRLRSKYIHFLHVIFYMSSTFPIAISHKSFYIQCIHYTSLRHVCLSVQCGIFLAAHIQVQFHKFQLVTASFPHIVQSLFNISVKGCRFKMVDRFYLGFKTAACYTKYNAFVRIKRLITSTYTNGNSVLSMSQVISLNVTDLLSRTQLCFKHNGLVFYH